MPLKPELGYTGERKVYGGGYEVRVRVFRIYHHCHGWQAKFKWDIFQNDSLLVEATSLRLAEQYIIQALAPPLRSTYPARRGKRYEG